MPDNRVGLAAIIIGLILLTFPIIGIISIIPLSGILLLIMAIYLFSMIYPQLNLDDKINWLWLVILAFSVLMGFSILLQMFLFDFLVNWVTATGLLLLIQGLMLLKLVQNVNIEKEARFNNNIGLIAVILGIIYLITSIFSLNVLIISILIAFALIIYGFKVIMT